MRKIFDQLYKHDLIIRMMSCDPDQRPQIKSLSSFYFIFLQSMPLSDELSHMRREHVLVILCSAAG